MASYYRLTEQPSVKYIAGYGIGRAGFPNEWTPCDKEPTPWQWHEWASKAEQSPRRYHKAKGGMLVMRGHDWYWCVEEKAAQSAGEKP